MLAPHAPHLEMVTLEPAGKSRKARKPLLFVHGGYCNAWCWQPFFMPWFAARGHRVHAVSLRGHGASEGHDTLFGASLDDYASDVLRAMRNTNSAPVLIGHSMGSAVIERIVQHHAVTAAALLAPIPPTGLIPIAARLVADQPEYLMHMSYFNPAQLSGEVLGALQPFYFTNKVDTDVLHMATRQMEAESPRALFDLSMRVPFRTPPFGTPMFVLGAAGDRIVRPDDARATATQHGVEAVIVPGLAHMMMLEPGWESPAKALADWIDAL